MSIVTKKYILFLFLFLIAVGQAFAVWDGTSIEKPQNTEVIGGKTFYLIENENQLAWFAAQVNKVNQNGKIVKGGNVSINAKLVANLNMIGPDGNRRLWTPIAAGNNQNNFVGTFDGNKHVISNIYISAEELIRKYANDNDMAQNIGFIGCFSGSVKDLILENIEVHGYGKGGVGNATNIVEKPISIGTVVGWQSVQSSLVEGCYVTGTVITSGDGQAVGGVVGNVGAGTVSNCFSSVNIYASGLAYVGGIAGYTKNFNGNVSMNSCIYAGETLSTEGSGKVSGKDSSGRAGAIIGYQYKGNVTLSGLYYDGDEFNTGIGVTTEGTTSGSTTPMTNVNTAQVICVLNNGSYNENDGSCSENAPWEVTENGPALIEYSADGYKITFDANGGTFAQNATSLIKYVPVDNFINNDGIANPSYAGDSVFAGWSRNPNATEPDESLGQVSGATKIYAVWNPLYTITFSTINGDNHGTFTDGSDTPKNVKIEKGKRISVQGFDRPSSYTEGGVKYNFVGWAFAEAPTTALVEGGLDNLPLASKDTTLLAVWTTAPVYTVSFYTNGSTTASYVSTVYQNDKATELTVDKMDPNPGYTFIGWYENLDGPNFDFNTVIDRDVDLFAKWEKDSYVITYENLNGATNPNPGTYTVDGFVLENPSLDNALRFVGWFKDPEFKDNISSIPAGSTGDLTLYASWDTITYSIIYKAGTGGLGFISPDKKIHNEDYTLPGLSYTRTGYNQIGWAVANEGAKVFDFNGTYEENKDTVFYPAWEAIEYSITYNCSVCDLSDESVYPHSYTAESSFGLPFPNVAEGYVFKGWFKDSGYSEKINNVQTGTTGNLKIYGKVLEQYTITYVGTDNSYGDKTYNVESGAKLRTAAPREGYTFGGWYTNAEFTGDAVTQIAAGATGDTTFYAKWIKNYPFVTRYGAVEITEYADGSKIAEINGEYREMDAVEISQDIHVNQVVFNRTFDIGKTSTIMLPFSIDVSNFEGGTIYKFKRIVENEDRCVFKVKRITEGTLYANTPYIVIPTAAGLTFNGEVTLNTTTQSPETLTDGTWEFTGVYQYTLFANHPELGHIYGFAGQERDGVKVGQFVKAGPGASVMALRAYLVHHQVQTVSRFGGSSSFSLNNRMIPDEIEVQLDEENEKPLTVGKFNMETVKSRKDHWFDLKGRKLDSKPTTRGTYYYNGKRVIVK